MEIPEETFRRVRVNQSRVVEILGGEVKVRVAPCIASRGFDFGDRKAKADLFIGSVIDESGAPAFKSAKEVEVFFSRVSLPDANAIVAAITELNAPPKVDAAGNSEGSSAT